MTQPQPHATGSAPPAAAVQPELTEALAFTRAWVLFAVLLVLVLGLLWLLQARYG
ncbi:hypothetical protein [uncultured Variovorax sp.]|uniref:hypothetical protein n=1 Tax=uncultured Variovorax sp. TaxID=114708 RepID=UPI0025E74634|nr:hypothetical protein [uncultured Variovorax sp.]